MSVEIKHKQTKLYIPNQGLDIEEKKEVLLSQIDQLKVNYDRSYDVLLEKIKERKSVSKPKIILMASNVLVKAVPPLIQKKSPSGIITGEVTGSERELAILKNSTENVSDFQEIVSVGAYLKESPAYKGIKEGDFAKIDFKRYRSLVDGSMDGRVQTTYNIPTITIDGDFFIMLDVSDITYVQKREDVNPDFL